MFSRRFRVASLVLGVALSAFFDGILLHQVLQWHHLLSLAQGATWRDLHNQVVADGLFHVGVYLVLAGGLWTLWGARAELDRPGAGRMLGACVLIGFGLWNVVDVVGFHWLAGIHRVRVDVADPLPWDLGWLAVLGAAPLLVGLVVVVRGGGGSGRGPRTAAVVSSLVAIAGAAALRPSDGGSYVAFGPGVDPGAAFAAVIGAGGLVTAMAPSGREMIVVMPSASRWRLYRQGALIVGGAGPAGCGVLGAASA
jgi:uncharacterized membrane protein